MKILTIAVILTVGFFGFGFGRALPIVAQTAEHEKLLEAELARVEAEIAKNQKLLGAKQQETASIARDVDILTFQINQAKLKIQAAELAIRRLGTDIEDRNQYISVLDEKISEDKQSLAELLRKARQIDDVSLMEVILRNDNISDVFADLDSFSSIQEALHQSFSEVRNNQDVAEEEKTNLSRKRDAELQAKIVIEQEKRTIEQKEAEKQRLLRLSKSEENSYRQVIAQREADRQAIRSALFRLRNVTAISFGEAYDLAVKVSANTGVRAALILAIITQESNLGENVGTCNRAGDPESKSWRNIMPGPNDGYRSYRDDQTLFLKIAEELGLDPNTTPLSCPMGGGWGGAMGPSQFIPTTWMSYRDRIAATTGNNPPNPWLPEDAFTATSLLLRDLGAAAGTFSAEREAALRYYAGGNWHKPQNAFYGNSVMNIAEGYERQISILQGT